MPVRAQSTGRQWRSELNYSICITTKNNAATIPESLKSILGQAGEGFEVVVVDGKSTDGGLEYLRQLESSGKIRLLVKRCSRGAGRELAFKNSRGDYVIANMDTDDVFKPVLGELLTFYHRACEGSVLLALRDRKNWSQNATIAPRALVERLGGWRDLQWGEDWDLWRRAYMAKKYRWTVFTLAESVNKHPERSYLPRKMAQRFERYRDSMRLGRPLFAEGEKRNLSQRALALAARASLAFRSSYADGPPDFNPYSEDLFIPFSDGVDG